MLNVRSTQNASPIMHVHMHPSVELLQHGGYVNLIDVKKKTCFWSWRALLCNVTIRQEPSGEVTSTKTVKLAFVSISCI